MALAIWLYVALGKTVAIWRHFAPAIWLLPSGAILQPATWLLPYGAIFGQAIWHHVASYHLCSRHMAPFVAILLLTFSHTVTFLLPSTKPFCSIWLQPFRSIWLQPFCFSHFASAILLHISSKYICFLICLKYFFWCRSVNYGMGKS